MPPQASVQTQPSHWHAQSWKEVSSALATQPQGLSTQEAEARSALYGENRVPVAPPISAIRRFLQQFHNILIYVLLSAALVTGVMQHWTDTAVIITVVLINATIGFIQEHKAEQALAAIRALLSAHANVLRDGSQHLLPAEALVPGDVIILAAGDKVPADLRLIAAHHLRIQESILTGESLDVEKNTHPVPQETSLGERMCMAYSGTLVTAGQGHGIVVATGASAEIGRISAMLAVLETPQTTLTLRIARFSRWLAAFIVVASISIFFFGTYIRQLPVDEMFMVMIGIAVSTIPEGLPAVISITMALGVRAMARRHAIVRHLPVIETLGSVTTICTDKTGTLTRNELAVSDIVTAEKAFHVSGVGYAPEGAIFFENQEIEIEAHPTLRDIGYAALLNNDAALKLRKGVWELIGDPTEGALMAFAHKAGRDAKLTQTQWPRTDIIPFSAESRTMATLHHKEDGEGIIYVKGAPESLLALCRYQQRADGGDEPLQEAYWQAQVSALAKEGKRVLAIAHRHADTTHRALRPHDIAENLTLLGLFGIMDTPRAEAKSAIAACLNAGIAVKMITGDHVLTASAIGRMLGIPASDRVMNGKDMEQLSETALMQAVQEVNIYARMHPEHKLRLVQALQASHAVVAMTGDGVNDAPALQSAHIGIAMGIQGTEVAKEASDLVLADDNFASIVHAIEEGRNITRNIRNTIQFMLVTDIAEGLTLLLATLAAFTLPITPLQILWVNMVTAITLSLAFAFAPHDATVMRRPPSPPDAPLFSRRAMLAMLAHVLLISGLTIGLFWYEMEHTGDLRMARTSAVNILVFSQIYYLLGLFPLHKRLIEMLPVITATASVILFQLAWTYTPWMQDIFATTALGITEWVRIILVSAPVLLWIKLEKALALKHAQKRLAV